MHGKTAALASCTCDGNTGFYKLYGGPHSQVFLQRSAMPGVPHSDLDFAEERRSIDRERNRSKRGYVMRVIGETILFTLVEDMCPDGA
jgi:hypothetical protein